MLTVVTNTCLDVPWAVPSDQDSREELGGGPAPVGTGQPIVWQVQIATGLLVLAAVMLGVVAHIGHPDIAPWHGMLLPVFLCVFTLAAGMRDALRAGAVSRTGWWCSRKATTALSGVAFVAALGTMTVAVSTIVSHF